MQAAPDGVSSAVPMSEQQRRRMAWQVTARIGLTALVLLAAYWLVPFEGRFAGGVAVRSLVGVVVLFVVVGWQLRSVSAANLPLLRAVEVVASSVMLTLVLFASLYRRASVDDAAAFSEPLNHIDALYLAVATMSTVGYGDVAAVSSTARVLVMLQIAVNVAVLAFGTRLAFASARAARSPAK